VFVCFLKNYRDQKNFDIFQKTQDITAEACGISKRSIQRICSKVKKNNELPETGCFFSSPRKSYKRAKYLSELDDFDSA